MALYKPSELRDYLRQLGIRPKKGFSQNFLIDGNIIRKIVTAAGIQPGDHVLEIGPGPGAVSEAIVEAGASLTAVELDRALAKGLERLPNTTIHCCDILEFDLNALPENTKVITNLPYHIATPILSKLVTRRDRFTRLTVMVQDEMARRMVAKPGSADYSSFSLFLEVYTNPKYAFKVSRNCFYPAPKVESAVVTLDLKQPPDINLERFFNMTRTAFGQRRKMLKNTLKELCPGIEETEWAQKRPEELGIEEYLKVFNLVQ